MRLRRSRRDERCLSKLNADNSGRKELIHYSKVVRRLLIPCAFLSTLLPANAAPPVMAAPAGNAIRAQYFSGFVSDHKPSLLSVSRKGNGKDMLHRSFVIDGKTKIEGKLHANARVTVRFETHPEGDIAVRVIVRDK